MISATRRVGQRIEIDNDLEVIVLDLKPREVKLGIRAMDRSPNSTPRIARHSVRGSRGYYHSRNGVPMFVVNRADGQRIIINDSIQLLVERIAGKSVRLSSH